MKHIAKATVVATMGLAIAGCDINEWHLKRKAKEAVSERLRDPDSAKFRNLEVVGPSGSAAVCGEVNGKNGFGAYAGYEHFISEYDGGLVRLESQWGESFESEWDETCRS
ncbi:hypothetical protein FZZ93_02515 [Halomonas eurihalina]|uniref:Lipoprotein n=1 Tax=Halomonas eurihalina TaxID=42566 RepID=A0A5D9DCB8_HALER|nr:hypothetical protein [Halomonas eurihalina]MDR5857932.1 hypothetical protein [Halomonas eurihalina]TZG41554.1 hypothetical protein FZZ93_02515 [Halomonas eurihalina]